MSYVDIVFDGPPSYEPGRFVEVENSEGCSIKFGEWVQRPDGYWVLRLQGYDLNGHSAGNTEVLDKKAILALLGEELYMSKADRWNAEVAFARIAELEDRIRELEAALKVIAACTPIPGPGFSLVLSMTSVAQKALLNE